MSNTAKARMQKEKQKSVEAFKAFTVSQKQERASICTVQCS